MLNKKKNNKGFTLVELLVVIAIIGILAVVAVPALFSNIQKSKIAKLESSISAIKSAAATYYADQGTYPDEISDIETELDDLTDVFGADYDFDGDASNPDDLVLTVTTEDTINQSGLDKLSSDFGDLYDSSSTGTSIKITLIQAVKTSN